MLSDIQILCPAKVNLGLRVYPKREDGFHNIESIFQTVNLCDRLTISRISEENKCVVVSPGFDDLPYDNTISKAYKAFCSLTGCSAGVKVLLEKTIPSGGGLGGGSSDAACFIKAFSALNQIELTDYVADKTAEKTGSDVFFFLHSGEKKGRNGCAIVSGRGEIVKPIKPRNDLYFVLIIPPVHSSTKEAYELVDSSYEEGRETSYPKLTDLEAIYNGPVEKWSFINTFSSVLMQKYPVIKNALQDLKKSGASWADMSGSGSVVFGVFESLQSAQNARKLLEKSWNRCVIAY